MNIRRFIFALLPLVVLVTTASSANAAQPWWHITSAVRPANLPPGGEGTILVQAINLGDASVSVSNASGESDPPTVVDKLPEALEVQGVELYDFKTGPLANLGFFCSQTAHEVACPWRLSPISQYEDLELRIKVKVLEAGPGAQNRVEVSGGEGFVCEETARPRTGKFSDNLCTIEPEANELGERLGDFEEQFTGPTHPATYTHSLSLSSEPAAFGVEEFSQVPEAEGGGVDVQAGSHPFQLTTTLTLNQNADPRKPPALPKTLKFQLPPGLVGNATAIAQCTDLQFMSLTPVEQGNLCPEGSTMGVADLTIDEPGNLGLHTVLVPLFNLAPLHGEPARFGFEFLGSPVTIDTSVRSGRDYGVTATVSNITELTNFISSTVTFWGVPGAAVHDESRGWGCLAGAFWPKTVEHEGSCKRPAQSNPPPFLTLPTSCASPLTPSVEGVAWSTKEDPAGASFEAFKEPLKDGFGQEIELTGCNDLAFAPSIEASPDVQSASTSSGLKVNVHVPQEVNENGGGLASSSVKDITVAFPAGMALNPSGGNGLEACGEGQVGFEAGRGVNGFEEFNPVTEPGSRTPLFSPTLPEPLSPGTNLGAEGFCPSASKIGTVKIVSPLIANPVVGSLYLATQNRNPFGSLVAAYIVAEDPVSGTLVKLPGEVSLCKGAGETIAGESCEAPGQVVSTFLNEPQLPFEEAEIHLFGGERAPLSTPARCGAYTTHASFAPWSGSPPVSSTSTFQITSGPGGGPCPGPQLPFSPALTGGTTSVTAGAFSPLTTTIARADGQQDMQSVQLHMPAGLSGILSGVKLCPEAQANVGTCGPESLIGETTVEAGVGNDPVSVKGGKVYLTEKYAGAPFGLSIVNPVKAGPFDLEHDTSPADPGYDPACDCLVVRARIEVDPLTAALTVTTDPSGAHAGVGGIPIIIDGIPVQIKAVNVTVNREHFTFNPTNCDPLSMTGTIAGDEGATSPVSVPFQVHDCANLKFTPTLAVSTAAKASKVNGASLHFKIAYPKNAVGSQSWMKEMKFDIPKQLPARLTTIQKACLAKVFETERQNCPPASIIGHLLVHTPVLPVPLEGPLYFVSYGGAAFPDAVAVIKGDGVTIESHGDTFINGKTGVTSATFETIPDVPFESIEVTVPQGPFSEFGANLPAKAKDDFCGQKLVMPIRFKAQNGLEITQNTPVGVTGCPKALTKKQKLAAALKACHKKHAKKRASCEKAARRAYGAKVAKKSKK